MITSATESISPQPISFVPSIPAESVPIQSELGQLLGMVIRESETPPQTPQVTARSLNWLEPLRIQTNSDLTALLGFKSPKLLTWLGLNKSEHYSLLSIRKKNGSLRQLHNPDSLMRVAQYKILSKIFNKIEIPEYVHAFERHKSIPTMAARHTNKMVVLSLDISDFFPSIHQRQLAEYFGRLGIGPQPARTLSELCTYKYFVPQGALTSPKLANIVTAMTFGPAVKEYCDANRLTLTIYADDITISSDWPILNVASTLREVTLLVQRYGFRINREKTKVMFRGNRQYVCGVVVNEKTNLMRRERYRLRAIVHNIVKNGLDAEAAKSSMEPSSFAAHIGGKLNWFRQLNPELGTKYVNQLADYMKTYRSEAGPAVTVSAASSPAPTTDESRSVDREAGLTTVPLAEEPVVASNAPWA